MSLWGPYLPVIVHNRDEQADLVHVLGRDVKDDGLVVDRIERVLLYGGFLLLQPPPVTKQGHFDVRICADGGWQEGREGSVLNRCPLTPFAPEGQKPYYIYCWSADAPSGLLKQ